MATRRRVTRLGDSAAGTCWAPNHDSPVSWTGVFTTCSGNLKADGIGLVRVGDTGPTSCGHTFRAISGSSVILDRVSGKALVREGDAVEVIEGGNGVVTSGSNYVRSE